MKQYIAVLMYIEWSFKLFLVTHVPNSVLTVSFFYLFSTIIWSRKGVNQLGNNSDRVYFITSILMWLKLSIIKSTLKKIRVKNSFDKGFM